MLNHPLEINEQMHRFRLSALEDAFASKAIGTIFYPASCINITGIKKQENESLRRYSQNVLRHQMYANKLCRLGKYSMSKKQPWHMNLHLLVWDEMPVLIFFPHARKEDSAFWQHWKREGKKIPHAQRLMKNEVPSIMLDLAPPVTSTTGSCTTGCLRIVFLDKDLFH